MLWFKRKAQVKPTAQSIVDQGIVLRRAERLDAALEKFRQALDITPEFAPALHQLGDTHVQRGEFDRAITHYEKLIAQVPGDSRVRRGRARCLEHSHRHLEAVAELVACLSVAPDEDSETRNALDALLFRSDLRLADSITAIEPATAACLFDADSLRILGDECLRVNRTLEASAAYKAALVTAPCCARTMVGLAQALALRDRAVEAQAWLMKAIVCEPDNSHALYQLGIAALRNGQSSDALPYFTKTLAADPQSRVAALGNAITLRELGRFEQANQAFHATWGIPPTQSPTIDQTLHQGLRVAHVRSGRVIPLSPKSLPITIMGGILNAAPVPEYLYQLRAGSEGPSITSNREYLTQHGKAEDTLEGSHLYAGPFLQHFGHFISECSHRLWGYRLFRHQIDKVLVLGGPQGPLRQCPTSYAELLPIQQQTLALFGIPPERVVVITKTTQVEHLVVPEQASMLGSAYQPSGRYLELLAENTERFFSNHRPAREQYPEKLYVSRAHLVHQGGIAGESYFEKLLQAEGFHLFRPEDHSLQEQLIHYRHARICLFSEGSAIHGLELLGRLDHRPTVAIIGRRGDSERQWRCIVQPRTPHYHFCACSMSLPPLNYNNITQVRTTWNTASILHELDSLLAFLREHLDVKLRAFERDDFFIHEAADISRYILHTNINPANTELNQRYFEEFRQRLQAITENPYLRRDYTPPLQHNSSTSPATIR